MYLSRTYDTYIIYNIPDTTNTTTMDVDRVFPSILFFFPSQFNSRGIHELDSFVPSPRDARARRTHALTPRPNSSSNVHLTPLHSITMVAKKPAAKRPATKKKPAAKKSAKKPATKRATAVKKTTATKKKPAAKKKPAGTSRDPARGT